MTIFGWNVSFIPYYLSSRMRWSAVKPRNAITLLSREGFDGVEWMLRYHFNSVGALSQVVRQTRQKGLKVSNIMCWEDFVTKDQRKRLRAVSEIRKYISGAASFSIPMINTFTGPITWNPSYEKIGHDISEGQAWRAVTSSFSDIAEAAEKNNVTVTIEAVFGMLVHDYYTLKELLSSINSKNIGVNIDPSHLALSQNDSAWVVSMLGHKVRHVHVKDVFGKPGLLGEDFEFPFLGEGIVDWRSFFTSLLSIGYSGFLSLEFENDTYLNNVCLGDWSLAAKESKLRLERMLSKVKRF